MRKIKKWTSFNINEEISKNEPMPEIYEKKIGIILLGAPGVGKSTFAKNNLNVKNRNIKTFSTDDVSYLFTKDPNVYYSNSSKLNIEKLKIYIKESNGSFIYDTTGISTDNINDIFNFSKSNGYKIIFIHLISDLRTSLDQNLKRDRQVDIDYLKDTYYKQFSLMKEYSKLASDSYYIVLNKGGKYKYYKYIDGKISIRKSDKYLVMENVSPENTLNEFIEAFQNLIDDDYNIKFTDFFGNSISPKKFSEIQLDKFDINASENLKKISIRIQLKNKNYEELSEVIYHLYAGIIDIFKKGWSLEIFDINKGFWKNEFSSIEYVFTKIERVKAKFNEESIDKVLKSVGFSLIDMAVNDDTVDVYFKSNSYDGKIGEGLQKKAKIISDYFGFGGFDIVATDSSSKMGRINFYLE